LLVTCNWFWATKEGMLFKTLNAILVLLSILVSVLGRRTRGHTQRLSRGRRFFFPPDGTVSKFTYPIGTRAQIFTHPLSKIEKGKSKRSQQTISKFR
jgi:hypothetical protein